MVKDLLVLALDIDGVLTDGRGTLSMAMSGEPRFDFHDLDAVTQARRSGLVVALVTGEDNDLVDRIAKRFEVELVRRGAKDKVAALGDLSAKLGLGLENFCYVGDSDRDAPALAVVGLGLAPSNATAAAKSAAHRVLANSGGAGAVAETVSLLQRLKGDATSSAELESALRLAVTDSVKAHEELLHGSLPILVEIAQAFIRAIRTGHKVLLFGNGGSAADAQHVAAELVGRFAQESEPYAAIALTTDSSVLTCVGNDWDYTEIFSRQVRALAKPGDVAAGISTSGKSPNVLKALAAAKKCGALTVGFTGANGNLMAESCDLCFFAPSVATPRIQELHILAWHAICGSVENALMR